MNPLLRLVAQLLATRQRQLVLAESCTAGLVAASLARIPGISNHLCGSAVTYQNATKHAWLDIPNEILLDPGPVSRETAQRMAEQVLAKTPHANLSASVTGHLGPGAPAKLDGVIFVAVTHRDATDTTQTIVRRYRLKKMTRRTRQQEAATRVLEELVRHLKKGH